MGIHSTHTNVSEMSLFPFLAPAEWLRGVLKMHNVRVASYVLFGVKLGLQLGRKQLLQRSSGGRSTYMRFW